MEIGSSLKGRWWGRNCLKGQKRQKSKYCNRILRPNLFNMVKYALNTIIRIRRMIHPWYIPFWSLYFASPIYYAMPTKAFLLPSSKLLHGPSQANWTANYCDSWGFTVSLSKYLTSPGLLLLLLDAGKLPAACSNFSSRTQIANLSTAFDKVRVVMLIPWNDRGSTDPEVAVINLRGLDNFCVLSAQHFRGPRLITRKTTSMCTEIHAKRSRFSTSFVLSVHFWCVMCHPTSTGSTVGSLHNKTSEVKQTKKITVTSHPSKTFEIQCTLIKPASPDCAHLKFTGIFHTVIQDVQYGKIRVEYAIHV